MGGFGFCCATTFFDGWGKVSSFTCAVLDKS
jgi:hypothetical protein